jgi:phosphomevalonate kinase
MRASAPGKIFLLGEYAVLEGHPALIGAVDRRVDVVLTPDAQPLRAASTLWPEPERVQDLSGRAGRVAAGVAAAVELLGECEWPCGELRVDSRTLFEGERKLGFGSSAAVVVATLGAIARSGGVDLADLAFRQRAFVAARRWHNAAQATEGSGGDIAASLFGGVTRLAAGEPIVSAAPVGAFAVFIHPQSASTPSFVRGLRTWARGAENAYASRMAELGALASQGFSALRAGDADMWLDVVRAADRALSALGAAAHLPIVTPLHRTVAALVEREGGACKPAGAGGGDLSLVCARDAGHLSALSAALAREGHALAPLTFAKDGLR